jgi:hypothetical protein
LFHNSRRLSSISSDSSGLSKFCLKTRSFIDGIYYQKIFTKAYLRVNKYLSLSISARIS